jgi:hypothetical protein
MPVVAENGFFFKLSHYGGGYTSGPTETIDHNIIPASVSVHVGLSRIQATNLGPLGAAVGIMQFGREDFGPNPADWSTMAYGKVGHWTTAGQVAKGEMTAWEFFQVWA